MLSVCYTLMFRCPGGKCRIIAARVSPPVDKSYGYELGAHRAHLGALVLMGVNHHQHQAQRGAHMRPICMFRMMLNIRQTW